MMIRFTIILATASLALASSYAVLADTTVMQAVPSDVHKAKALKLAGILNSEAIIIGDDASDAKTAAFMQELISSDPELVELDRDDPGIVREIARVAMPIINKYYRIRLPELHARQSDLYFRNFSEQEIDRLIAFYASPTGQKMITLTMDNLQPNAVIEELKSSGDWKTSSESVLTDIRRTIPGTMAAMTDADLKEMEKLMQSGLLVRMKKIANETQTIALTWMDETAPGEDEEMAEAMSALFERRAEKEVK
ncbi:DUF2059 domain-containing protein [Sphingorhabdus sp.]|uniref:DUF2059 domain-containing protein n=1 Tax=Sphingorhabdus sp. TaxID=1902408 RepID=UPI003593F52F